MDLKTYQNLKLFEEYYDEKTSMLLVRVPGGFVVRFVQSLETKDNNGNDLTMTIGYSQPCFVPDFS